MIASKVDSLNKAPYFGKKEDALLPNLWKSVVDEAGRDHVVNDVDFPATERVFIV